MAVTGDSPEKQHGGIVAHCHGAADQAWSSAEVAAVVVFQTDRRRAAPYRPPPHSCLSGSARGTRWSSGWEQILLNHASDATYPRAGNRIVGPGDA